MPLEPPNLDDRNFYQLMAEARARIKAKCKEWDVDETAGSAGDPGIVLLELFAHLTEVMIYRLNRLPDKAFVEFLRLIGLKMRPPAAAEADLRFTLPARQDAAVRIPRGTQVTVSRGGGGGGREPVVFTTDRAATIEPGETAVTVAAHHCELVEAEEAGTGTALPGQWVRARRPPVVAPTGAGDGLDLRVAVEATADELKGRTDAVEHQGRGYRVWREVADFAQVGRDDPVFVADRTTGVITFAPAVRMTTPVLAGRPDRDRPRLVGITAPAAAAGAAGPAVGAPDAPEPPLDDAPQALAAVPPAGRRILLWYRRGGGPDGNFPATAPLALRQNVAGVKLQVTLAGPATGGQAGETLENAVARGPQELHSLERAVTARDFELLALASSGAVARAKAFTRRAVWAHASRGEVEVLLVPALPDGVGPRETLGPPRPREAADTRDPALEHVRAALDERRPLGTDVRVGWVKYKTVRVNARVVVHRGEDAAAVERRVLDRLYQTINPLPAAAFGTPGWPFGTALRASHVYDIILKEPGVSYVDRVRLLVDEVPDVNVLSLTADPFQPRTWYAAVGPPPAPPGGPPRGPGVLFRSMNDGDGWEPVWRLDGAQLDVVECHPRRPGLVAVASRDAAGTASRVHVSADAGETWDEVAQFAFVVEDVGWTVENDVPVLLLATASGLYHLPFADPSAADGAAGGDAAPVQLLVDPDKPDLGFYAVAVTREVLGGVNVAVAARQTGGVYVSQRGGRSRTFEKWGLDGKDVRVLEVQYDGPRAFLWAGTAAVGAAEGDGCFVYELRGPGQKSPAGWQPFAKGWRGGSCRALAFQGTRVAAATYRSGVLWLAAATTDAGWQAPDVKCNLPLTALGKFHPVEAVAADPDGAEPPEPPAGAGAAAGRLLLAGGPVGVYRSRDGGVTYEAEPSSRREFLERVTLPPTWLFASGRHEVNVEEAGG